MMKDTLIMQCARVRRPHVGLYSLAVLSALSSLGCSASYGEEPFETGTLEAAATVSSGASSTLVGVQSGKCLGVKGASTADGAQLQIQGCNGSDFQVWTATLASDGYYVIKNKGSSKCIDVPAASTTAGTRIIQYTCGNGNNQRWSITDKGSSRFAIVSKTSGLALDVENASTANGAYVIQWGSSGATNQLWTLPGSGSSGGGTSTDGCNVTYADKPVGYAAMGTGTVGGGNVTPIKVTTAADLKAYLADSQPRVLYVMNDLDFRTANRPGVQTCNEKTKCDNGSGTMIEEPRVSATCSSTEFASTSYRYETTLSVASNKTVIGVGSGSGAAIRGASFNLGSSKQVIFRNLKIHDVNPHLVEAGDGFTINGAQYVWLDHIELDQISDGLVDIGSGGKNITLSYVRFRGKTAYQCGGQHHYVSAIDASDVTIHHSFYDNVSGRNPKIGKDGAHVHLYNNYWLNVGYFCITAQADAEARVESNYFENSKMPHWLQTDGNGTAGIAIDGGNVYTGASTSSKRDTGGSVFSVPYSYAKSSADAARSDILKCVGPRQIR